MLASLEQVCGFGVIINFHSRDVVETRRVAIVLIVFLKSNKVEVLILALRCSIVIAQGKWRKPWPEVSLLAG